MKIKEGFILILVYLGWLAVFQPQVYTYRFDPVLINSYLQSQDIPHEVDQRVFLSDGEIHIAAGYLYAKGADPTVYNFQHPPLLKYLYGLSILVFHNPYFVQLFFVSFLPFLINSTRRS